MNINQSLKYINNDKIIKFLSNFTDKNDLSLDFNYKVYKELNDKSKTFFILVHKTISPVNDGHDLYHFIKFKSTSYGYSLLFFIKNENNNLLYLNNSEQTILKYIDEFNLENINEY